MRKRNKEASGAEKPLFDDLKRSLLEAGTIARGEAKPARHFKAEIPDTHRSDETERPKSNSTGKRDGDGGEEFTAAERNLIRIAFRDQRWGGTRSIDEGLFLGSMRSPVETTRCRGVGFTPKVADPQYPATTGGTVRSGHPDQSIGV